MRIVAALLVALLTMTGALVFLTARQGAITRSLALVSETYWPLAEAVGRLERDRQRLDVDRERQRTRAEIDVTGIYTEQMRGHLSDAQMIVHRARAQDLPPDERAFLFNRVEAQLRRVDETFTAYDLTARNNLGDEALDRQARLLNDELETLRSALDDRIDRLNQQTRATQDRATRVAALLAALAVLLSVPLLGAVLAALRPLDRLTTQVQRLAAGEYGGRVEVRGSDEVAVLATEFNAMVQALESRDRSLQERADELRRLSTYLRSVVDSLEEGLVVVEGDRITLTNPSGREVWGVEPDHAPPAPLAALLAHPGRHELTRPDGSEHAVRVAPFGKDGVVVVADDVSERNRVKAALARSERLALVGQMLAQITHEVRNPLNAMALNADMLGDEIRDLDPDQRTEAAELLGVLTGEVDRLTEVTGHYLQLARRPPARLEPTELTGLIEDVQRLLVPELEALGATLTLALDEPFTVLLDGNQMRQALLNLVQNAVEAGARTLVLTARRQGGELVVALDDDGPGMTEEELERAFDPFYSTKASGTGLGLAITRQILEDHGGTARFIPRPEGGLRAELYLPA